MPSEQYHQLVDMLWSMQRSGDASVEEMRQGWETFAARFTAADDLAIEAVDTPEARGEWVSCPSSEDGRIIFYLHGGGYNMGTVASYRAFAGRLAKAAAARVFVVDYRLAPEHPFPAAVEDATMAFRWLRRREAAQSIVIAGDSAGGGLALSTAINVRDQGMSDVAAAIVCISPSTDLAKEGESMKRLVDLDPIIKPHISQAHALRYVVDPSLLKHPLASPLYAELSGLPPLLVLVGSHEVLLDDSTRLVEKAKRAGVDAQVEIWDQMIHIWPFFAEVLDEGREAIERIGRFIRERVP